MSEDDGDNNDNGNDDDEKLETFVLSKKNILKKLKIFSVREVTWLRNLKKKIRLLGRAIRSTEQIFVKQPRYVPTNPPFRSAGRLRHQMHRWPDGEGGHF